MANFDRYLDEEAAMCDEHEHDTNAPHGANTDEEMDVDADDQPDP